MFGENENVPQLNANCHVPDTWWISHTWAKNCPKHRV